MEEIAGVFFFFLNEAKMVVRFLRMQQLVDMQPVFLILALVVVNLLAGGCSHGPLKTGKLLSIVDLFLQRAG